MRMENSVFNRTEVKGTLLSSSLYNFFIGLTLLWGFGVNLFIVETVNVQVLIAINPWIFMIGFFVVALAGVFIFNKSDNPLISFLGYNLVVIPFGFVVNIAVSQYNPEIVKQALTLTALTTGAMMCLGYLFPAFFQRIIGAITIALIVVIVVSIVQSIFFNGPSTILDWIIAFIFCGYIGYDWGRANAIPRTLDNAIDSAAALYMDIINLFLALLRILGARE